MITPENNIAIKDSLGLPVSFENFINLQYWSILNTSAGIAQYSNQATC
jgi:hypothetical protein